MSTTTRELALKNWLQHCLPGETFDWAPASSDASFRRYFRLTLNDGRRFIAMDAPPELEDSRPFVQVADLLQQAGVRVPLRHQLDLAQGFMLLEDFGSTHYQDVLTPEQAPALYRMAMDSLVRMQQQVSPRGLPPFDAAMMLREMAIFDEWYLGQHLQATLDARWQERLQACKQALVDNLAAQSQVFMHRDYHCRNLMLLADGSLGIIDFQGAMQGPVGYDLASLLKDAYIDWPEEAVLDWVVRYWSAARKAGVPVPDDIDTFYRDVEWAGVQRHLKVVGLFARLHHRDGKSAYLQDLPRVLDYLGRACRRYVALTPVARLLDELQGKQAQVGYTF